MKDIVYQQIRNEMTAISTSFRQLEMGQYVVVAALVTTILSFSKTQLGVSLGAGITLAGLILGVTWLGGEWFSAATRQGAYLLVAYEIPELESHQAESEGEIDRKHLWILANRAESLKTLQEKYPGKHSFGTGLRTFYWHQAVLAFFSFIVIAIALFPHLRESDFPKFMSALIAVLLLFDICLCVFGGLQSGGFGKSQVKKWHEYLKDRPNYDKKFLNFMELEMPNKPIQPTH